MVAPARRRTTVRSGWGGQDGEGARVAGSVAAGEAACRQCQLGGGGQRPSRVCRAPGRDVRQRRGPRGDGDGQRLPSGAPARSAVEDRGGCVRAGVVEGGEGSRGGGGGWTLPDVILVDVVAKRRERGRRVDGVEGGGVPLFSETRLRGLRGGRTRRCHPCEAAVGEGVRRHELLGPGEGVTLFSPLQRASSRITER